jgi:hypothetical protein
MKKAFFIGILSLIVFSAKSQDDATNANLLEFYGKVKQTKFVDANITKTGIDLVVSRGVNENQDIVGIRNFVNEKLGLSFIVTPEQRNDAYSASSSYCNIVSVSWKIGSFESIIGAIGFYPFEISFAFCDGKSYTFNSKLNVSGTTYSFVNPMKRAFDKMFPDADKQYSVAKSVMKSGEVIMNETELKAYYDSNTSTNKREGIYKLYSSTDLVSADKVALVEKNNKLYILNLENKYFKDDYKYGEVRGEGIKTSTDKIYIGKYKNIGKLENDISMTFLNEGMFEVSFTNGASKMVFIKL